MKEIQLRGKNSDKFMLVDDDDYNEMVKYKWNFCTNGHSSWVQRTLADNSTIKAHRSILKVPKGLVVDHINHNTLDNRKSNLRICTDAQNKMNCKMYINQKVGFKGVYKHNNGYVAQISMKGKKHYIGFYSTKEEAAKAYDKKAIERSKEFNFLNFPKESTV